MYLQQDIILVMFSSIQKLVEFIEYKTEDNFGNTKFSELINEPMQNEILT